MTAFDQPIKQTGEQTQFSTGSVRDNKNGKGRYDLLPFRALDLLAKHFEKGAAHYGDRNWEQGQPVSGYIDSGLRHLSKHVMGQRDEPHLVAAAWNIMCALDTLVRIDEGLLPSDLNDLPRTTEEIRNALNDILNQANAVENTVDEENVEDAEAFEWQIEQGGFLIDSLDPLAAPGENPVDTLERLINERNSYRSGYQATYEALTALQSQASLTTHDPDAPAKAAYVEKAAEIGLQIEDESSPPPVAGGCTTKSCGCHANRQVKAALERELEAADEKEALAKKYFYVADDPAKVIYTWTAPGIISWPEHTHENGHSCPAGSSTMKTDENLLDSFFADGTFIPVPGLQEGQVYFQ